MTQATRKDGPGARWRQDVLDTVAVLLTGEPDIARRTMFGVPAFFVAGRPFCCVWGDGVGLRFPRELAETLVGADGLGPFRPFGRAPMAGWVQRDEQNPGGLADDEALIRAACAHVRSL